MNNHQFPYPEEKQKPSFYEEKEVPKIKSIYPQKFTLEEQQDFLAWKRQADEGFANAQLEAGLCYEKERGVEQSYQLAFHYYQLAADQGNVVAQLLLGMLYENGQGVNQSYTQAICFYKLAAKKGNVSAQVLLGRIYSEGRGIQKSPQKAIEYYQMAANAGNLEAYTFLATSYEKGIGIEKSQKKARFFYQKWLQRIKEKADAGDALSQVMLGLYLEKGEWIEKSMHTALHYYKLSAAQNCPEGLYNLAECFADGKGIRKNREQAIRYYTLAANQGYSLAQATLGCYLLRNNTDRKQAVLYLKEAINSDDCAPILRASCLKELANCFERGIGTTKSNQSALYYYTLAADGGNVVAQHRLGEVYSIGQLDTEKSAEKAIHYYTLAANQEWTYSLIHLARWYEKGKGVEQSAEKAFQYYKQAAEIDMKKGNALSILELARCYRLGIGTAKSLETAMHYYKFAAENGLAIGYLELGRCYQEMGGKENMKKADAYIKLCFTQIENERQLEKKLRST